MNKILAGIQWVLDLVNKLTAALPDRSLFVGIGICAGAMIAVKVLVQFASAVMWAGGLGIVALLMVLLARKLKLADKLPK